MFKTRNLIGLIACMLIMAFCPSCGCDEDGNGGPVALDPPDHDISGVWACTEVADESDCGDGTNTYIYNIVITQDGNDLDVEMEGQTFNGTISGSVVRWTGSFPEEGGTTTITNVSLTVAESGTEITGTMTWRWADDEDSCEGTSDLVLVWIDDLP